MQYNLKKFKLSNGTMIPVIGLGTWLIDNDKVKEVVKTAYKLGYIHIDTAQAYENEEGIGEAIEAMGIDRSDIYITSKVKAEIKNYQDAKASIDESLKKLRTPYIDLMLIHCPQPWNEYGQSYRYEKENLEVWKALVEAYDEGKLKAIGVSNFNINDLNNIIDNSKIKPMVNQCASYPGNTPIDIIDYCKKKDILFEAYSPIAHGRAINNEKVLKLAKKYNKSFAQICLKYGLSLDVVILPKASSYEHLKENLDLDFEMDKADLESLR